MIQSSFFIKRSSYNTNKYLDFRYGVILYQFENYFSKHKQPGKVLSERGVLSSLKSILQFTKKKKNIYWFSKLFSFLVSMCMNNTSTSYKTRIYSGCFLPVDRQTPTTVIRAHILQAYSEDNQTHLEKARQLTDSVKIIRFPKIVSLM